MRVLFSLLLIVSVNTGCRTGDKQQIGGGWMPLFDGHTLNGWEVKCKRQDRDKKYWTVENEAITARVPQGSRHHYIWLMAVDEYDDFELKLKVQTYADSKGNSGIQVRSRYDDEAGWLDGPQVDINPRGPWRNGFIYDETREVKQWISPITGPPSKAKPHHAPEGWKWFHADREDAWNDVHIICRGAKIKTVINGVTVVDYDGAGVLDDEAHRARDVGMKGHILLQIHPGGPLLIRFKDIMLKAIAPDA